MDSNRLVGVLVLSVGGLELGGRDIATAEALEAGTRERLVVLRLGRAHHPPVLDRILPETIREGNIEPEPLPVGHVSLPARLQVRGRTVGIDPGQSVFDDRGADPLAVQFRIDGRANEAPPIAISSSVAAVVAMASRRNH